MEVGFMMMVLWFQWAGSCVRVPARSSSSGQYESSRDVKRYLVSALGNINHTLFASFSLMPPQPCGQLWTVARETRAKAAGSQWKRGRPGLCPCISLPRPHRHGLCPDGGQGGREEGSQFKPLWSLFHYYFVATAALLGQTGGRWDDPLAGEWKYSTGIPASSSSPYVD